VWNVLSKIVHFVMTNNVINVWKVFPWLMVNVVNVVLIVSNAIILQNVKNVRMLTF